MLIPVPLSGSGSHRCQLAGVISQSGVSGHLVCPDPLVAAKREQSCNSPVSTVETVTSAVTLGWTSRENLRNFLLSRIIPCISPNRKRPGGSVTL